MLKIIMGEAYFIHYSVTIRGTNRDAESLLKFLNLVCNQNEEELWGLPAPEVETILNHEAAPTNTSVTVMADPGGGSKSSTSGLYNGLLAMGVVAVLALFAGYIHRARQVEDGTLVVATPAADKPATESGRQMQKLLADIDSTIGRMAGLLLRLVRARLGLVIAPADDDASVAVAGGASAVDVTPSPPSTSSPSRPLTPGTPLAGGGRLGGPTVASAIISSSYSASDETFKPSSSITSRSDVHQAVTMPVMSHQVIPPPPPAPPSPEKALEMALKMKSTSNSSRPRIPADQVLALLDEEDDNVSKVVDRLMRQ